MQAGKTRSGNAVLVAALLAALWLCAGGVPLAASSSNEEVLRTRVGQFYAALQQGNWESSSIEPKASLSARGAEPDVIACGAGDDDTDGVGGNGERHSIRSR